MYAKGEYDQKLTALKGDIKDTGEKTDKNYISLIICLHGFYLAL
jgi:hypothetical protein